MLGEFDYARRELTTIKKRLQELATPAPQGESRELSFLKARTLDLLQHIYVDSKLTLDHISETFKTASTKQVLEAVDRALLVGPPLRRAFGSEDDGRTVQVLIDAAVWRSKFVWVCGIIFIAAMGVLGFSITDLSKQGDLVRKTLLEARAQADQNIKILNDGIREIEAKRAEVEVRRKEIIAQIEALQNPDSAVNKVVARFNGELSRLSDLERDWGRQREKLATELSRHESFLTGKEDQINRRVVEFEKLVVERTSAIEAIVERARGIEKALEGLRDAAQGSANTIAGLIGSVQADANIVRAAREQTTEITNTIRENAEKVVAARRDAEEARDRVRGAEDQLIRDTAARIGKLDGLVTEAEGSKKRIDVFAGEAMEARAEFAKFIDTQRKAMNDAATAATKAVGDTREKFIGDITESARQTTGVLTSAQATAGRSVQLIQDAEKDSVARSATIRTTGISVDRLQTEITSKLEQLKTDEERLRGERDRAKIDVDRVREIIKTVEDKRADIQEKLHMLLDARPSIDAASIWKLIAGSYVLLGAIGAALAWLLILTTVVAWRRRAVAP